MSRAFDRALFHGTLAHIDKIDVTQGKPRKDFGRGFYLALSAEQAIGMMHKKLREATRRSRNKSSEGFVERLYKVQLKPSAEAVLKIRTFDAVDMEWLDFVLLNRETSDGNTHDFDMVVGPTADDDTMVALRNYWRGLFGPVGSLKAKQMLLEVLEPENLGVQCCLCTPKAVELAVMSMNLVDWRMFA